jgi:oligopeptide transport system permease protein
MHLVPGGPWASEKQVAPGVEKQIDLAYHLDEPVWMQYGRWVLDVARGDFGPSFRFPNQTINQMLAQGLPATLQLALMAFTLSIAVGVPLGIVAALRHNQWPDYLATGISVIGIATPTFVIAIILVVVFSAWLKILTSAAAPQRWRPGMAANSARV